MFIYSQFNGLEPAWVSSLIETGLPVYSPARPFSEQIELLSKELENVKPSSTAYEKAEALNLPKNIWKPLAEVKPVLEQADLISSTEHCIWRDQWLISRADLLIVENGASMEIPILAYYLDVRTVAISFTPTGMSPWLAKIAHITINSPNSVDDILSVLNITDNFISDKK